MIGSDTTKAPASSNSEDGPFEGSYQVNCGTGLAMPDFILIVGFLHGWWRLPSVVFMTVTECRGVMDLVGCGIWVRGILNLEAKRRCLQGNEEEQVCAWVKDLVNVDLEPASMQETLKSGVVLCDLVILRVSHSVVVSCAASSIHRRQICALIDKFASL